MSDENKRSGLKYVMIGMVVIVITGLAVYGSIRLFNSEPIIPSSIRSDAEYTIFSPQDSSQVKIDRNTIKYDKSQGLLSYVGYTKSNNKIVFSEQATPESFTDIPQVYDSLITSLQEYYSFESPNGKVFLTHPKELSGGQSSVMNSKGTLMFAKPTKDISNSDWQRIYKNLEQLN